MERPDIGSLSKGNELNRRYSLPLATLCRSQDGICDVIDSEAIPEGRRCLAPTTKGFEEIGKLMDEGMLIAYLQARHPPPLHVGVVAVADVNALPSAQTPFIAMIEELEAMEIMQIPSRR